jgi:uncharacterized protein with PIN domain
MNDLEARALTFACDAMLGGLARWLRAAGYDASWTADIDDWDLIRQARREGRMLLTCDTGIFKIGIIRDGDVPAVLIPHGLKKREQLRWLMARLQLVPREPRCMACGGELVEVPKESVKDTAPPRSYAWQDRFFKCARCQKLFWRGTHWEGIKKSMASEHSP